MLRERIIRIIKNKGINIRILGIYAAVIILVFTLGVPMLKSPSPQIVEEVMHEDKFAYTDRLAYIDEGKYTEDVTNLDKETYIDELAYVEEENIDQDVDLEEDIPATTVPVEEQAKENIVQNIEQIIWPLKGEVIQEMGLVYSETFDDYRYHDGIDIKGEVGDEVIASLGGQVVNIKSSKGDKITILIAHGNDWQSEYSHLDEAKTKKGDVVKAGQIIGVVGQPGLNEVKLGPHLHYRLIMKEQNINPLKYLP
ncbi:MAG: hypothetical protein CVU87_03195 [Firmicutes bacterium HGW-Firmicutes-12]|jgi:murein DD-endopeptidase MepM/ murein hydrolase activator NlpD|nr:MAG: hypothetical protein CVU87_03195 [Firmicutes bacterium HGW-Firmicutes-12]